MPEIRCPYCSSPNPVQSEYLVFCSVCGKRLPGTFAEWKKKNPAATFQSYLKTLEQENAALQMQQEQTVRLEKKSIKVAVLTVLLLMAGTVAGYLYYKGMGPWASGLRATPPSVLHAEWKRYTCGRFGLSVMLPGKLKKVEQEETGDREQEQFAFSQEKGFQAELLSIRSKERVISLENAVNEAVNSFANQPGISGIRYRAQPIASGDIPGVLVQGTLEREGVQEVFYCAVFVKSFNSWGVTIRHLSGDEIGAEAADKLLDSIEINYFATAA